ncbi:MAG: DUF6816 family protein [Microcoleaceae cyanobacterium]
MKSSLKVVILCFICLIFLSRNSAQAGQLSDRVENFPNWQNKPSTKAAQGDLVYPTWMAGEWQVTSTLVEMVAPLAPEIVTPGFESNRQYLNQPIQFKVRFQPTDQALTSNPLTLNPSPVKSLTPPIQVPIQAKRQNSSQSSTAIVSDRAFNGLNIAIATLGKDAIQSVKVDPKNPNRQITLLKGYEFSDRQLISTVTEREREMPNSNEFIATEIVQQVFRGESSIYLNEVEITTSYQANFMPEEPREHPELITADQITAIYLSPQDPNYFKALGHPVALYRYQLQLLPVMATFK